MTRSLSSRVLLRALCAVAFAGTLGAASAHLHAQRPYHILAHWKIGGTGGWDYMHVDPAAHRLYLAHGPRVEVIDTTTGKEVGAITGLHGTHGIAFNKDGKYGYISDGGGDAVVVFNRRTLAKVATVPAGSNPDGIIYEPATNTVWAFNGHSHNATVIDAATNKVAATIALPGKPEFPQVDGKGTVFDNIESTSQVVRMDARMKRVTAVWPAGCDGPSGLAIDTVGHRLFPVCDGKMSVIDYRTGKLLANPSIGDGPDAVRWSARHHLVLTTCGDDGILAVVDASASGYPTIERLTTQRGARTMAYDPEADRIYTVTAEFGPRPAPSAARPHPRPSIVPGTYTVIVIGR